MESHGLKVGLQDKPWLPAAAATATLPRAIGSAGTTQEAAISGGARRSARSA